MAALLAMCVGLVACGGGNTSNSSSASSSSSSSSSSASSSSSSSSAASSKVAFWEGALNDGSLVFFTDDATIGMAGLGIVKEDLSSAVAWTGASRADGDDAFIITDAENGQTVRYVVNEDSKDLMRIDVDGYGVVDLRPVTEAEYNAFVSKLEKAGKKIEKKFAKQAKKLMEKYAALDDSTILFWDGTLDNGNLVSFMDDQNNGVAFLAVVKPDYSNGMSWYGNYNADAQGKVMTLRDDETGQTVAYEVLESTPDTSMKLHIDWYGDVDLKPVTKADFDKYMEELSKYAK